MSILKKKRKTTKKKCPSTSLTKAEQISEQYKRLSKCCEILSEITPPKKGDTSHVYASAHRGGWRMLAHSIENAGIDIEEVYNYIGKLANKKRAELECELAKLDAC